MLLSSLSYKCKWQLAPFSPTHSWRGILKHHSSPPFTSSVDPTHKHTHTTDTVRACLVCRAVMTNNSHALKVSTSTTRAASFSHRKATTLTWFIYLFSLLLWCLCFSLFLCVCVCVCVYVCVSVTPSLFRGKQTILALGTFKKPAWGVVRWPIFTLTPNKTLHEPWWMVLTSYCRGWR